MAKEKLKKCETCGQEIAKSCKVCPNCGAKNKKPFYKKWWLWLIVVIVVVAVAGGGGSNTQEPVSGTVGGDSAQAETETKTDAADTSKTEKAPDLELVDNAVTEEKDAFSLHLVGTVRNNRAKDYSYAQITFNLFDADGNQIGTAMDNINNLKSGGTWKFKAISMESPDAVASYELAEITGW